MDDLSSTTGIVAVAAAAVAVVACLLAIVLFVQLRRLRADQRAVLGSDEGGARDLVTHAAGLDRSFTDLHDYVTDVAARLDGRLATVEGRMDGAIAHCGLLRYDAYNEMSGRQSTSIALLDSQRSGVILSSIHHRDQARLYAKQVTAGQAELKLSPEEEEAINLALSTPRPGPAAAPPDAGDA